MNFFRTFNKDNQQFIESIRRESIADKTPLSSTRFSFPQRTKITPTPQIKGTALEKISEDESRRRSQSLSQETKTTNPTNDRPRQQSEGASPYQAPHKQEPFNSKQLQLSWLRREEGAGAEAGAGVEEVKTRSGTFVRKELSRQIGKDMRTDSQRNDTYRRWVINFFTKDKPIVDEYPTHSTGTEDSGTELAHRV